MKLPTPKNKLSEIIRDLDSINSNVFQLKQFTKYACELIEKNEPMQKLKHLVDVFRPMEALNNLEFHEPKKS